MTIPKIKEGYSMKKINLAIVGYGGMGGWHRMFAQQSDVIELLGIYDIAADRCQLAEENNIYAYPSLEAVLADERVELITVATPNDVHKEIVIKALDAGKNVISEKPAALSVDELDEMIAAANRSGKLFTVHQNRRWDVDYLAMQQIADSGEIGEIINIESRIHGSRGIPSDWRGIAKFGGGMLYDWGVHLIDQVMLVIPEKITGVYCTFDHITNDEVDDGFKLTITFESGKTAYVEVGTYNFIAMPRFYLRCKSGTALITDWRENCQVVKCKYWHENDILPVQTAAGLTKTMAPRDEITTESYKLAQPKSDVHDFYRNVCKAIRGEENQIVTHPQLRRVMQVIEAAFRSVELRNNITCDI